MSLGPFQLRDPTAQRPNLGLRRPGCWAPAGLDPVAFLDPVPQRLEFTSSNPPTLLRAARFDSPGSSSHSDTSGPPVFPELLVVFPRRCHVLNPPVLNQHPPAFPGRFRQSAECAPTHDVSDPHVSRPAGPRSL